MGENYINVGVTASKLILKGSWKFSKGAIAVSKFILGANEFGKVSKVARIGALGLTAFGAAGLTMHDLILSRYPRTFTANGFGSGFGTYGRRMPFDGGIGATGDLVLSASNHRRF